MSKRDTTLDPKILDSAKQEFLKEGFLNASLKSICGNAEVTTGALYKRYKGKEELFLAVVQPLLDDLNEIINQKKLTDPDTVSDEALIRSWDIDESYMLWWFEFLYQRKKCFKLLLCRSEGSKFSTFSHDWVQKMSDYTYEYYKEAYRRHLTEVQVSRREMHVLLSAFWETIYEPFVHDFSWEEIIRYNQLVCNLFDWYKVLGFKH